MQLKITKQLGCLLISSLVLVACGNTGAEQKTNTDNEFIQAVADPAQEASLTVLDENEKEIKVADLKGKVVFINFWATWCPPCIEEMPSIAALKKKFKDNPNIVFLMVDVDNNLAKSKKFMAKQKLDLPVHVPYSQIPSNYLGNSIPTTVILDKKGEIVVRTEGARDYNAPKLVAAIEALVLEK